MTPSRHVFKKKSVLLLTVALLNIYAFTSLKPLAHAALPGDNTMPPVFQQKSQRRYTGKNNSFTPGGLLTLDTDPSFPPTQTLPEQSATRDFHHLKIPKFTAGMSNSEVKAGIRMCHP